MQVGRNSYSVRKAVSLRLGPLSRLPKKVQSCEYPEEMISKSPLPFVLFLLSSSRASIHILLFYYDPSVLQKEWKPHSHLISVLCVLGCKKYPWGKGIFLMADSKPLSKYGDFQFIVFNKAPMKLWADKSLKKCFDDNLWCLAYITRLKKNCYKIATTELLLVSST